VIRRRRAHAAELTLPSAPAGQDYLAVATIDGSTVSSAGGILCKLEFGPTTVQTIVLKPRSPGTFPITVQGAGELSSGSIVLSCTGSHGSSTSNASLTAYVLSALN
jgi:hypothetical protein